MKIKHILPLLLTAFALTATAQNLRNKAIVVYKADKSQDTILWRAVAGKGSYFYGKENPADDDYVTLKFTISDNLQMNYNLRLTPAGQKAPYRDYGAIMSSSHINTVPNGLGAGYRLYFTDKAQWYDPDYNNANSFQGCIIYPQNVMKNFAFAPGQTLYARAYYILDGKNYFSSEIEARVPKSRLLMREYAYGDYVVSSDSVLYKTDAENIVKNNATIFGEDTNYQRTLFLSYLNKVLAAKEAAAITSLATKTEACDDGMLYIIDEIPSSLIDEALNMIREEMLQPFYVQAIPENVYAGGNSASSFGTLYCTPTICQVDEKWGLRDNQYLYTSLEGQSVMAKPTLALTMNHLMKIGQVYDISLIFAPNIQNEEADTLSTYFYVSIADESSKGYLPTLANAQRYGNDTIINNRGVFIARPREIKVMTMQYTPTNFTNVHVLQLTHQFNFVTVVARSKYGREFRVVGIEVKPHE